MPIFFFNSFQCISYFADEIRDCVLSKSTSLYWACQFFTQKIIYTKIIWIAHISQPRLVKSQTKRRASYTTIGNMSRRHQKHPKGKGCLKPKYTAGGIFQLHTLLFVEPTFLYNIIISFKKLIINFILIFKQIIFYLIKMMASTQL